jgi:hypothetical protein
MGFNAKLGALSESTLALMKYSYIVDPTAGALLVIYLIPNYDLSGDRAHKIKADLTAAVPRRELPNSPLENDYATYPHDVLAWFAGHRCLCGGLGNISPRLP